VADKQGDAATITRYRSKAAKLKVNLNKHGWDGEYFARAYTDSGEKITFNDAIVQAWAVLSGGADKDKGTKAIDAAIKSLYKPDANEILLFDKVLDKESWGGALAAYPNGLRENNAQYTHGSSWLPRAVAEMDDGDMAVKLYKALLPTVHSTDPRCSCIPKNWPSFKASYKNGTSTYQIEVKNPSGVSTGVEKISVDGVPIDVATGIALLDDGKEHRVEVQMGPNGKRRARVFSTPV
jgi:cellobiose phosphorylase